MSRVLLRFAFLCLLVVAAAFPAAADEGADLTTRARAWIGTLSEAQRRQVLQPFASADRKDWHYVPRSRRGLAMGAMRGEQRIAARALLAAALSSTGLAKAEGVFALESVLRDGLSSSSRARSPSWRDPLLYQIAIFGRPASTGAWALRIEGHHLSVNVTVRDGRIVSTTPLFFGANPSTVRRGARAGLRPLAAEEDQARALVRSLPPDVRRRVVASAAAPADVQFGPFRAARPTGQGVAVGALDARAQGALMALIRVWVESAPAPFAARALGTLKGSAFAQLRFVWLGSLQPGRPHAYRIEGPTMILEYVNRGDHVHAVWRSPTNDFGASVSSAPAATSRRR